MRKRFLLLFLLMLIMPITVRAEDNVTNNLKELKEKDLTEVTDLNQEKELSKTDGLGGGSSFKSIASSSTYIMVSRGNGTIMFLDKNTFSVVHEQKYNLSSSASIAYDPVSNYLIASLGNGKYTLISLDTFEEGSTISLSGDHIAYNSKFARYITYSDKGNIYNDKSELEVAFTIDCDGTKNDIHYSDGYIYLINHNSTNDKLYDTVEKNGNIIYIFNQNGKLKKTFYITEEATIGNNKLVSLTVIDKKAYLLYDSGEIVSSSVIGNVSVAAEEAEVFLGAKFINVVRNTFFALDYYIYSSIVWIIQGLFDIAKLRSYTDIVSNVRNKLYIILGIIMMFRLSLTFIKYLMNPDDLTDRFKGSKRLIFKTILMLVLLLMIPSIFEFAYRVQYTFIPIIPKVVLSQTEEEAQKDIEEISNDLAVVVLSPFFHPNYTNKPQEFASIDGSRDISSLDDFVKHINDVSPFGKDGKNPGYSYEYRYVLSSIVGFITLFLLVGITVSAATRFFKLLVLEMLAPIPVLLNISPYRDETNPFTEWLKEFLITFVDIFIKLSLMYLILFFVSEIKSNDLFITWESAEGRGITPLRLLYLKSFLTVGLLLFVYKSPKYLNKIFGLDKQNGSFLGSVTSSMVGFGSGFVTGMASGAGFKGSLREGVKGMNASYQNAAAGQLKEAWGMAEKETLDDANKLKNSVGAAFQAKASQSKSAAQARKGSLGKDELNSNRDRFRSAQEAAKNAENKYRDIVEGGPRAGEGEAEYNDRRAKAYSEWQNRSNVAKQAEKDYMTSRTTYDNSTSAKRYKSHKTSNVKKEGMGEESIVMMTDSSSNTIGDRREQRLEQTSSQDELLN